MTTTGIKRNTAAFATAVTAGTHLWAVCRFAMATTQPTIQATGGDWVQGNIQTLAGANALTTYTNDLASTIPSVQLTGTNCPNMRGVLD